MGRAPCCDKANVKKGPWSPEEDAKLKEFIEKFGTGGNWIALPQKAGLKRCGKSCRLRWLNYLRPNIKHGEFSDEEDRIICSLYASIGSRWSIIAAQLPGRTDNDIKNYWNTKLKKKLIGMINHNNNIHMNTLDQRKFSAPIFAPTNNNNNNNSLHSQSLLSFSNLSTKSSSSLISTGGFDQSSNNYHSLAFQYQNLLYNNNITTTTTNYHDYNQNLLQDMSTLMMNLNPNPNPTMNPMQFYPGKDNMLVFGGGGGGNEASCSSSDGSCSQISYGKEININGNIHHHQGYSGILDNYQVHGGGSVVGTWNDSDNVNVNRDHHHHDQKQQQHQQKQEQEQNVFSDSTTTNAQLEYDLEEVKQLISSAGNNNGCSSNNINTSFFMDDEIKDNIKTNERGGNGMMYYYYY